MTNYDLTLPAGEDLAFTVTVYDSTGVVINLTTYSAKMQFRPSNLGDPVIDLSDSSGNIALGSGGTITIFLSAATIALVDITEGVYDLIIEAGSNKTRVLGGSWIIERAISQ